MTDNSRSVPARVKPGREHPAAPAGAAAHRTGWSRARYLWFAAPSFVIMSVVMLFPLGYALFNSFFSYTLGGPRTFVGLGNYLTTIASGAFWHSVTVSVLFTLVSVALQFALGMYLALLLDKVLRGRRVLSTLLYLPYVITASAAGVIFRWMLMPEWGILNQLIEGLGLTAPNWFDDGFWALVAVIGAEVWQNTPFVVIILFAGLQSVSDEQVEAALIDGASPWGVFRNVKLPHLRHLILLVLMMRTMDTWRLFDRIYVMTGGGPGDATETMVLFNFRTSFRLLQVGQGLAVGFLTLVILLIPIGMYLRAMRSAEVD
ncbi:MAG: sugar ABC transporter permease [Propionicimonas sp.]